MFRQNALIEGHSIPERDAEEYFRINTAVSFVDEVVGSMKRRFEGQVSAVKGTMLIPFSVISEPDWNTQLKPFLDMYTVHLPSRHTLDAELELWKQKWTWGWSEKWETLQQEHVKATGSSIVTPAELKKLKQE